MVQRFAEIFSFLFQGILADYIVHRVDKSFDLDVYSMNVMDDDGNNDDMMHSDTIYRIGSYNYVIYPLYQD